MEDELPTAAAALPKPKKQLTPAQRAVESAKRQDRRKRAKLRLAEAAAAQVAESQQATAFQARDNAIAIQAAAQVVLMLKGEELNAALANAGIVDASVTGSVSSLNRPPRPGSPALSSASPPCVLPPGLAPPEISSVPNALASTLALQETLKGFFAEKEMPSVKRGERKRREKEDHMKEMPSVKRGERKRREKEDHLNYYLEIQKRKLEIDESNAQSRAKEVDLKSKEVELAILAEENRIMMADLNIMDPDTRAWFVKRRKAIMERDA